MEGPSSTAVHMSAPVVVNQGGRIFSLVELLPPPVRDPSDVAGTEHESNIQTPPQNIPQQTQQTQQNQQLNAVSAYGQYTPQQYAHYPQDSQNILPYMQYPQYPQYQLQPQQQYQPPPLVVPGPQNQPFQPFQPQNGLQQTLPQQHTPASTRKKAASAASSSSSSAASSSAPTPANAMQRLIEMGTRDINHWKTVRRCLAMNQDSLQRYQLNAVDEMVNSALDSLKAGSVTLHMRPTDWKSRVKDTDRTQVTPSWVCDVCQNITVMCDNWYALLRVSEGVIPNPFTPQSLQRITDKLIVADLWTTTLAKELADFDRISDLQQQTAYKDRTKEWRDAGLWHETKVKPVRQGGPKVQQGASSEKVGKPQKK